TEVVDGELDITFLHGTENTLVNAIEIKSLWSTSAKSLFVINDTITKFDFKLSQNPIPPHGNVKIMVTSPNVSNGVITFFALNGKVVKTKSAKFELGKNELNLYDTLLERGIYLIQIEYNGESVLRKLLVN
ncbi:T9SS type A sorting domain-containing protein, partial [Maribacter dokdonensis]|uniref:T9SS type A sorting domain-containing protein n=1 Tax=Maribacter dokdonensis TaxID=320912 RepID=UPI0027329776